MNCHVINLMSPVRHTCQWDIGSGQCAVKAEQSVPAGGRSHFFNVSGTMGCFFLDHCCILTTALPLVQSAAPFIETGSCVKRDRHFQPIRGSSPEVTHFQSHFLWWNQCSHLLAENLNFTHTQMSEQWTEACLCYHESVAQMEFSWPLWPTMTHIQKCHNTAFMSSKSSSANCQLQHNTVTLWNCIFDVTEGVIQAFHSLRST